MVKLTEAENEKWSTLPNYREEIKKFILESAKKYLKSLVNSTDMFLKQEHGTPSHNTLIQFSMRAYG